MVVTDSTTTITMTFPLVSSLHSTNIFGQQEQQPFLDHVVIDTNLPNTSSGITHLSNERVRRTDSIYDNDDDMTPGIIIPTAISLSNSSSVLLPEDYQLSIREVLCGRGKKCYDHIGNEYFRQLVNKKLLDYVKAPTKTDKMFIIREVIHEVRTNSPYGGFIKYNPLSGRYYKVSDVVAREKTSQAFRDSLYNLYKTKSNQALLKGGGTGLSSSSPSSSSLAAMSSKSGVSPVPVKSSFVLKEPVLPFVSCTPNKTHSGHNTPNTGTCPTPSPSRMTNITLSSAMNQTMNMDTLSNHPRNPMTMSLLSSSSTSPLQVSSLALGGPAPLLTTTDDLSPNLQVALNDELLSFLKTSEINDPIPFITGSLNHNIQNNNNFVVETSTCRDSLRLSQFDLASFVSNHQAISKSNSSSSMNGCGLDDFRISPDEITGCNTSNDSNPATRTPRTVTEDPIIPPTSPTSSTPGAATTTYTSTSETNLWDHLFSYAARTCDPHTNPYEPTPIPHE